MRVTVLCWDCRGRLDAGTPSTFPPGASVTSEIHFYREEAEIVA
jgi:hypothetical protein